MASQARHLALGRIARVLCFAFCSFASGDSSAPDASEFRIGARWTQRRGRRRREAARGRATRSIPFLNAFAQIDTSSRSLTPAGRLGGVPYAAKDLFQTSSHRPGGGFLEAIDLGIVGTSDLLERLDAAGADLIGFTNMTELAYEPSGFNATRGRVKNPWNLDYISGGSSSGSAAAVASGAVVAALGSDTGGSVRIPAHACGITAWKPTHGAVSARGTMPLAPTLDTIGLLARSASDMMPLAGVMAELPSSRPMLRAAVPEDVVAESDPAFDARSRTPWRRSPGPASRSSIARHLPQSRRSTAMR